MHTWTRQLRNAASGVIVGTVLSIPVMAADAPAARPLLATTEQLEAEKTLLGLLADPDIKALQAKLRAQLAATPVGQSVAGAATVDRAITLWTNSFLFKEITAYRPIPAIIWGSDDTPHSWFGHTIDGAGSAGDNPDNVYRLAILDGAGRYEITGKIDLAHRPSQFSIEVVRGNAGPVKPQDRNKRSQRTSADLGNQIAMITDRELVLADDGSFRITLGGEAAGPNHLKSEPGTITAGIRDSLSDWSQRPVRLDLRRLDQHTPAAFDQQELKQRALDKLTAYVEYWAGFSAGWFGGIQPNAIAPPIARDGGWGFVSGLRFQLQPDEAILVTTTRSDAQYTGAQVIDPWMLAADSRRVQSSLNLAQATANADGSYTYIIAAKDPGVANWLDTNGLHDGFAILRWQGMPAGVDKAALVRDFRKIKLSEVALLKGVATASAQQRKTALAAREQGYTSRTR